MAGGKAHRLGAQMFGASVRGPRNEQAGRNNQDAWLCARGSAGHLIVVCDGLGSRVSSEVGARAACVAVRRAVSLWPGVASGADPQLLARLVEVIWRLVLAPRKAEECATTCMFALREPGGHLLIAGLGDGLALLRRADGTLLTRTGRREDDFANETCALGTPHRPSDWWVMIDPPASGRTVVLATDGVSDDLDPTRLDAFAQWLAAEVGSLSGSARGRRLRRELQRWPVPHHVDDKTVAVMVEPVEVAS